MSQHAERPSCAHTHNAHAHAHARGREDEVARQKAALAELEAKMSKEIKDRQDQLNALQKM